MDTAFVLEIVLAHRPSPSVMRTTRGSSSLAKKGSREAVRTSPVRHHASPRRSLMPVISARAGPRRTQHPGRRSSPCNSPPALIGPPTKQTVMPSVGRRKPPLFLPIRCRPEKAIHRAQGSSTPSPAPGRRSMKGPPRAAARNTPSKRRETNRISPECGDPPPTCIKRAVSTPQAQARQTETMPSPRAENRH